MSLVIFAYSLSIVDNSYGGNTIATQNYRIFYDLNDTSRNPMFRANAEALAFVCFILLHALPILTTLVQYIIANITNILIIYMGLPQRFPFDVNQLSLSGGFNVSPHNWLHYFLRQKFVSFLRRDSISFNEY